MGSTEPPTTMLPTGRQSFVEKPIEELKITACHLGNGSSIAAVKRQGGWHLHGLHTVRRLGYG